MALGAIQFRFSAIQYFTSAFRRQIGEAVEIKESVRSSKSTNLNSKLEYNRCMIPDITSTEQTHKEDEAEVKLVKRISELKSKATLMHGRWKTEMAKRGRPVGRVKQRTPNVTPSQLECLDPKRMTFEELNWVFTSREDVVQQEPEEQDPREPMEHPEHQEWIPVLERVRRIEEALPLPPSQYPPRTKGHHLHG